MQELATFLGPQNRTQGRCELYIYSSMYLIKLTLSKKAALTQSSQAPDGLDFLYLASLELIVWHASYTAIPFRSDPALAAVGGVLGT